MTERKSTEIKFRVTPSEKARWQADAEREGVSLSELICWNMNVGTWHYQIPVGTSDRQTKGAVGITNITEGESWVEHNRRMDGKKLLEYAIDQYKVKPERRKEPCSHSKPPYAFCAECDT